MTKSILHSMCMYEIFTFFDHCHLKMNLEKSLLTKWKILKPRIVKLIDEDVLTSLYNQAINMCEDSNKSVIVLIKRMEKIILNSIYN